MQSTTDLVVLLVESLGELQQCDSWPHSSAQGLVTPYTRAAAARVLLLSV